MKRVKKERKQYTNSAIYYLVMKDVRNGDMGDI